MIKTSILICTTAAIAIMTAMDNVHASYVRRTNEDSASIDFDGSDESWDNSGSLESMFQDELPSELTNVVPKYGQCGGIGYVGNIRCAQGYVCVLSNPWYAQCLPKGSQTSVPRRSHRSKAHTTIADLLVDDINEIDVVPAWEQCGGKGVDFDFTKDDSRPGDETPKKSCEEGYSCEVINEWYYQCQPDRDLTGIKLWDQCGGEDYKGPSACTAGAVCKYFNSWYSQCVPKEQEFS
ncbi:Carbohydrate esterase [Phytophthora megakarya]|uniref:Carbohydrate esterase n=1 Tax=Phytophthora megakarya TaxID=4795 RepID=A0A225WQ33_9STRA|nr:Carbohydrate esterase [Phytophthora megakarya]